MNHGLEILLVRMDTHPSEFYLSDLANQWYDGKWATVLRPIIERGAVLTGNQMDKPAPVSTLLPFIPDEDIITVYTKLMSLQDEGFTNSVMRALLAPEDEDGTYKFSLSNAVSAVSLNSTPYKLTASPTSTSTGGAGSVSGITSVYTPSLPDIDYP